MRNDTRSQRNDELAFLSRVGTPVHAERDIVVTNLVCPSVCPMSILYVNEWTYRHTFLTFWQGRHFSSFDHISVTKFQGNPLSGGVKCTRGGKILQILPFVSKTVRDRLIVTMEH